MADLKIGDAFGLDKTLIKAFDWNLSLKRILTDLRSDFIFAPHLAYVYAHAGDQLKDRVTKELSDGAFLPGHPITIEVPKTFRMRINATKRLGPNYSRPGSILLPRDRLLFQALADQAAPIIKAKTDNTRSFSHRLAAKNSEAMFLPTRKCWNALQKANKKHAILKSSKYVIRLDIANFFGAINLHTLVNVLNDSGYPKSLSSRLENMLITFTGNRSSRGILQGIFPSDLLGNYYLNPVDRFLKERKVRSARYVDDIYIFVKSVASAENLLRNLVPYLRTYDLVLHEAKSAVMPSSALITEEPDLEVLFENAIDEVSSQLQEEEYDVDYGFQSEWDDDEEEEEEDANEELELKATIVLFDSLSTYSGHEENIERFCLPLFARVGSDYAVDHVLASIRERPAMTQIYAAYLVRFIDQDNVAGALINALKSLGLFDWQRMWILAALLQADDASDAYVKVAVSILSDANSHEALRAVAAIYVGRFGDHGRRLSLQATYAQVSPYIQAAIYFSSRTWTGAERANAKSQWGAQGELNTLLTEAMSKAKG